MTLERSHEYLLSLLRELVKLSNEKEWVEFKQNNLSFPRSALVVIHKCPRDIVIL